MMKYPKDYLEEIKIRLKVSQVVGKSVKLKKRGKEFIGLSPFSNEKTPSFTVNDEKGFYHCFSSGEHGNIFDFLMKIKNFKFGEAVRTLAADAGMPIYKFTKFDEEKEKRWKIYTSIHEEYVNFCHQQLVSGKYSEVSSYLSKRKITDKEINFFKIGYSFSEIDLFSELKKKFDEKQISLSGIFYFDENKKKYVDRFRNRIIFPVKNLNGLVIALGARTLSSKSYAKYVNSPETEFYKKGNNLYNINNFRAFKTKTEEVFLVEGYMDVINLHKFGITNVAANLGTAITERQIELIWRFFKNIIICLDGDSSGQKAALRVAERIFPHLKPNFNIYFLTLPENLDPDSFINQKGKESFLKLAENKIDIQKFIWQSYFNEVDKNNPHSLSLFEKKIKSLCMEMNDKILAKYFLDSFIKKIKDLTPNLDYKKSRFIRVTNVLNQTKEIFNKTNKFSERQLKEFSILFLIINNLDIFKKNIQAISEINFSTNLTTEFKNEIINYLLSDKSEGVDKLTSDKIIDKFKDIIDLVNSIAPVKIIAKNKNNNEVNFLFNELLNELNKIDLRKKIESLEDKVSLNLDEKSYSELLSLRSQLKDG